MFACWDCQNLEEFVQVSARGDAREIRRRPNGWDCGEWDRPAVDKPGIYCAKCNSRIEDEIDSVTAAILADTRVDFVAPGDFDSSRVARELTGLRSDADWNRIEIDPEPARTATLTETLAPVLLDALARTGRRDLFIHQVAAIDAALRGEHVVQATAAGSGKSLGFVMPVLHRLLESPRSTAVLVFPLRALANDQLNSLAKLGVVEDPWISETQFDLDLGGGTDAIRVARYDGSTPEADKPAARREARLLITTPDMMHASILRMARRPYKDGSSWERLLRGLSYVVLDEIHSYSGVFGSNVAQVLRRLRRAVSREGGEPRFLAASATIGNPRELAEALTGVGPFTVVDDDGSPQFGRTVLICNPPMQSEQTAKKTRSRKGEGAVPGRIAPQTVALEVVGAGTLATETNLPVRSITFARSRNEVQALTKRIQKRLEQLHRGDLAPMVAAYTATLMSDDRVAAEGSLRDGSLLAVVSTNALELGIDIPDLSVAVLCGYPGQISSFRQRAGRCGRAGKGLVVLILGDDPLQQHLAQKPEALQELLAGRAEDVIINADAPEIVARYGLSAAEADFGGIAYEDAEFFGVEAVERWLSGASGAPDVHHGGMHYWRTTDEDYEYPSIRGTGGQEIVKVICTTGRERKEIGVLDTATAPRDVFVPAIWAGPKGELYRVKSFNDRGNEVYCEGPVDAGYLTRGIPVDTVDILDPLDADREVGPVTTGYSRLRIRRNVYSYKEQHFSGSDVSKSVDKRWPEYEFDTEGLHIKLPVSWDGPDDRSAAIKAFEHILLALAPVVVACDPDDLEATSDQVAVYVYDSFGAGIGISHPVFKRLDEVLRLARDTIASCPCTTGCPGCIVLSRRPEGNRDLSKAGALYLLEELLDPGSAMSGGGEHQVQSQR